MSEGFPSLDINWWIKLNIEKEKNHQLLIRKVLEVDLFRTFTRLGEILMRDITQTSR